MYLEEQNLDVEFLGRGMAWLDTGTFDALHQAGSYIRTLEKRQGLKVACIEEIALSNGWINEREINNQIKFYGKCEYSEYLKNLKITKK